MFLVSNRSSTLVFCLMVGGTPMLLLSASLGGNNHERASAFVACESCRFSAGADTFTSRKYEAATRSRWVTRWPTPPRARISSAILRRPPLSAIGDGDEEGEDNEMERGVYIPTETLLDDPQYVERILAAMGRLTPAVPTVDESVFRAAVNHHCALRTSNIVRAIKFYSLLGMKEVVRFRAESARCAFLEGAGTRLELIEVPASMQPPDKAQDLTLDMRATGLNHIAFDVGPAIEASEGSPDDLRGFLSELNRQSEEIFGMSVRLAVSPFEQRIGQDVYDVAFITDADGVLLELLHNRI
ncbi:unnamed protein product [Ascophyllum nodosum]